MNQKSGVALKGLATAAAVVAMFACGGGQEEKQPWLASNDTATTANSPTSPGGAAEVPQTSAGATLMIVVRDGALDIPPGPFAKGPVSITLNNQGNEPHNLFIEGTGVNAAAGDPLPAGQGRTFTVELPAGTHTFYCPVADHRTKGEQVSVTVGG